MAHKKTKTERNVTTDEGKVSGQQPQMYAKNSLDRFGDDLCQHLLSYLPLEDRFRHECLSKQWQRLIYETIDGITINRKLMKKMKTKNIFGEKSVPTLRPLTVEKWDQMRVKCLQPSMRCETIVDI
ncbi:unnamed protein product [Oppiella nova]|uniref:F-box domain-containing protein n=1 Tax=Oppiella nova TaxID=334625 RepID=A0A7R9M7G1_9ACAR|nr:unnamed protein product [Oppiella nova]CAG2172157.1 unnamed protein product [Oppiella nova]